jgi:transcriptional regulator of arginine metabolism
MKSRRQAAILELVSQQEVTSQEQLRALLRGRGIETTQATLSRDIRDLGLFKAAADGAYRLGAPPRTSATELEGTVRRAVGEYLRTFEQVQQLMVLKTEAGQAQALAIVLDRSGLPDVVGTIAGDDTILVICRSVDHASAFAERLGGLTRRTPPGMTAF